MEFRVKMEKKKQEKRSRFAACAAAVMMIGAGAIAGDSWRAAGTAYAAAAQETSAGADAAVVQAPTFDPARFVLPDLAKVLVAVEGTGGSTCKVYAYDRIDGVWKLKVTSDGYLGANGMSNHRHSGDKTTPIGVFCMNTPFGLKDAQGGFPVQLRESGQRYVWSDISNTLEKDSSGRRR